MAANLVFMAGKGGWPKSYVIPSVVLSLAAGGLLVWHFIDPAKQIDAWTVTLLVIGFLPWLRPIFETIAFPGGGSLKFRELAATQERQGEDIHALQFLVARYLTDTEKEFLRRLVNGDPLPLPPPDDHLRFMQVFSLTEMGLVAYRPEMANENEDEPLLDFKDVVVITDRGKQYLSILDRMPEKKLPPA